MDRFNSLELDEPKSELKPEPKLEPKPELKFSLENESAFSGETGLRVSGGKAQKRGGSWFNSLGLESTETHRHVSKIWQAECTSFTDMVNEVNAEVSSKEDFLAEQADLRFNSEMKVEVDDGIYWPVTLEAIQRMCSFQTDIPSSMLEYLHEKGYVSEMARFVNDAMDFNALECPNRQYLVRTRKQDETTIRAILSDRYGIIDNAEALEMIASAFNSTDGILSSHYHNDGDTIRGNLLIPDSFKSNPDSQYGVGIFFSNSEVGRSSFKVNPFLFRAICLNGMIWSRRNSTVNVNKKHLGSIDLNQLRENVKHAVEVALTEGKILLTAMENSMNIPFHEKIIPVVMYNITKDDPKITREVARNWWQEYQVEPYDSVFGIVNGLTRSAQNFNADLRQHMEEKASSLLLPGESQNTVTMFWERHRKRAELTSNEEIEKVYQYLLVS